MKKFLSVLAIIFGIMPVMAYDLDISVDKEIQQKYDADKLNKNQKSVPTSSLIFNDEKPNVTADSNNIKNYGTRIPKWTKFKVRSNQKISNWSSVNSTVSFTTITPVYKKSATILTGTILKGKIKKVHKAQISGNGALVEIEINSMYYNGKIIPLEGKITKANSDLIFFNKIKGDRQYINGVDKKIKSANNFYTKSRNVSNKLSKNPIGTILAPIPTIVGFVGATAATIASPITGLIEKGGNVSLPAGTTFEIKLLNDAYMN